MSPLLPAPAAGEEGECEQGAAALARLWRGSGAARGKEGVMGAKKGGAEAPPFPIDGDAL